MLFIQGILEKQRKRNKNWQMSQYIIPYQQMSVLANVCIGKCSIYISKCHKNQARQKIGKCLDQQMTYQQMCRLANVELANVAQQMSGQQMSNQRMTAHPIPRVAYKLLQVTDVSCVYAGVRDKITLCPEVFYVPIVILHVIRKKPLHRLT